MAQGGVLATLHLQPGHLATGRPYVERLASGRTTTVALVLTSLADVALHPAKRFRRDTAVVRRIGAVGFRRAAVVLG